MEDIAKALLKMRDTGEIENLLSDLLTRSEVHTLELRFQIAIMLYKKIPYKEIERATGASSATITKVNESLKYGKDGLKQAIERMKI